MPQILIENGYSAESLYSVYMEQMHGTFNKMEMKSLFCLKFLNCCVVIGKSAYSCLNSPIMSSKYKLKDKL